MKKVTYYYWPLSQECTAPRCIHASIVSNPGLADDGAICHLNYDKTVKPEDITYPESSNCIKKQVKERK